MENLLTTEQHVTVPPMPCSFPVHCHPDLPIIQKSLDSWILSQFNPSSDPDVEKLLVQSKYPLFSCLAFANCQTKRCISAGKFLAWVCILEDSHDNNADSAARSNISASDLLFDGIISSLKHNAPPPVEQRFAAQALDWWNEIRQDMSATQQSRCLKLIEEFILGWKSWNSDVASRATQRAPDLDVESYLRVCRRMSAAPFCYVLLEYCLGIELDEATLRNPLISELQGAITDHLSLVYELVTLEAMFLVGEFGSLLFVIYSKECPDLQESVHRMIKRIRESDETAARLMREIKKSRELMKVPGLDRYLDGLGNWMAGNIKWSYVTARYLGVDAEEKRPDAPFEIVFRPQKVSKESIK